MIESQHGKVQEGVITVRIPMWISLHSQQFSLQHRDISDSTQKKGYINVTETTAAGSSIPCV